MSTTYYLPGATGWASTGSYANTYYLRLKVVQDYDAATNKSTLTVSLQAHGASGVYSGVYYVQAGGTLSGGGNTLYTFVRPDIPNSHAVTIDATDTWRDLTSEYKPNSWSFTVTHSADGKASVPFAFKGQLYAYLGGASRYGNFDVSATLNLSEPRASSIASAPTSVATQDALSLTVSRASSAYYHKLTVTAGGATLYTSAAFATTLSVTVPRTWFNGYPSAASFSAQLSVQTYTDSACTTPVGSPATASVTVTADAGMKPALASGFAAAAPYNTGTAASGITGYVQGYSKAKITLDPAKLSLSANATVKSYAVACQGQTQSGTGTSYTTATLTGSSAITVTVTVTDSRDRTASTTLTVTPMAYAAPTLSAVTVFRCDASGAADDAGAYYSAKATEACSSLGGQNSVTLTARYKTAAGSYGAATTLTSGTARVLGGALSADASYTVLLTAADKLGNSATVTRSLPTQKWAMRFRAGGEGVAFGKSPEHDKALELPSDWKLYIGDRNLADPVGTGTNQIHLATAGEADSGSLKAAQHSNRYLTLYANGSVGSYAIIFESSGITVWDYGTSAPVMKCYSS